jgi:hypothetical protein
MLGIVDALIFHMGATVLLLIIAGVVLGVGLLVLLSIRKVVSLVRAWRHTRIALEEAEELEKFVDLHDRVVHSVTNELGNKQQITLNLLKDTLGMITEMYTDQFQEGPTTGEGMILDKLSILLDRMQCPGSMTRDEVEEVVRAFDLSRKKERGSSQEIADMWKAKLDSERKTSSSLRRVVKELQKSNTALARQNVSQQEDNHSLEKKIQDLRDRLTVHDNQEFFFQLSNGQHVKGKRHEIQVAMNTDLELIGSLGDENSRLHKQLRRVTEEKIKAVNLADTRAVEKETLQTMITKYIYHHADDCACIFCRHVYGRTPSPRKHGGV